MTTASDARTDPNYRPRVRGLLIFLSFSGLIGLWSAYSALQPLADFGFLFSWQVYLLMIVNVLGLVSATLIARYMRSGLVLGLIATSYTLYYSLLSVSTFMIGGMMGGDTGIGIFAVIAMIDAFLKMAVIYYLAKYLIASAERDYFL